LPGNREGQAHGGGASGIFHFVAGEGKVGHCPVGGHGFNADSGRIGGEGGGSAVGRALNNPC
jgi:hypothetical protein